MIAKATLLAESYIPHVGVTILANLVQFMKKRSLFYHLYLLELDFYTSVWLNEIIMSVLIEY